MKKRQSKICVRCGAKVGEYPGGCSAWGEYWKRHDFQVVKYDEIEVKLSI